jgi:hypothetical protein
MPTLRLAFKGEWGQAPNGDTAVHTPMNCQLLSEKKIFQQSENIRVAHGEGAIV